MDIRLLSQYSKVSILHIIYVTDKIEKKTLPLIAEKKKNLGINITRRVQKLLYAET